MSPTNTHSTEQYAVRIPADIEREDKIFFGLAGRQAAILAATGLVLWSCFVTVGRWLPLPVFAVPALLVVTAGGVLALGGREGLSADRYLLAAWRFTRSPRLRALAPHGVPAVPGWVTAEVRRQVASVAPLQLPVRAVHGDGVLELDDGTAVVLAEASTVGFAFRTPGEQQALVGAFARWLNSLTEPVQIVVRAQWVDLGPMAAALTEDAPALPHPALERAARDHAAYLAALGPDCDLIRRQVLIVFVERQAGHGGADVRAAGDRARRRAEAAARTLAAAEIHLTVLNGGQAGAALRVAGNPLAPLPLREGWAAPEQIVTGFSDSAPTGPASEVTAVVSTDGRPWGRR